RTSYARTTVVPAPRWSVQSLGGREAACETATGSASKGVGVRSPSRFVDRTERGSELPPRWPSRELLRQAQAECRDLQGRVPSRRAQACSTLRLPRCESSSQSLGRSLEGAPRSHLR